MKVNLSMKLITENTFIQNYFTNNKISNNNTLNNYHKNRIKNHIKNHLSSLSTNSTQPTKIVYISKSSIKKQNTELFKQYDTKINDYLKQKMIKKVNNTIKNSYLMKQGVTNRKKNNSINHVFISNNNVINPKTNNQSQKLLKASKFNSNQNKQLINSKFLKKRKNLMIKYTKPKSVNSVNCCKKSIKSYLLNDYSVNNQEKFKKTFFNFMNNNNKEKNTKISLNKNESETGSLLGKDSTNPEINKVKINDFHVDKPKEKNLKICQFDEEEDSKKIVIGKIDAYEDIIKRDEHNDSIEIKDFIDRYNQILKNKNIQDEEHFSSNFDNEYTFEDVSTFDINNYNKVVNKTKIKPRCKIYYKNEEKKIIEIPKVKKPSSIFLNNLIINNEKKLKQDPEKCIIF